MQITLDFSFINELTIFGWAGLVGMMCFGLVGLWHIVKAFRSQFDGSSDYYNIASGLSFWMYGLFGGFCLAIATIIGLVMFK